MLAMLYIYVARLGINGRRSVMVKMTMLDEGEEVVREGKRVCGGRDAALDRCIHVVTDERVYDKLNEKSEKKMG